MTSREGRTTESPEVDDRSRLLDMQSPGGQKVKDQGHTVTKTVKIGRLLVAAVAVVLLLPAWDCTSYDCLGL